MTPADTVTWRGTVLAWRNESWPAFDNHTNTGRAFFARVVPDGRMWIGELKTAYRGAELGAKGSRRPTPEAALDDALHALRIALAEVFPTAGDE
jgi:hypothetical protein